MIGHDLLLQIEAAFRFLETNPEVFQKDYEGVRKHIIKRFPYKIVYLLDKNRIVVIAVLHHRRNPTVLKQRRDNM